MKRRYRNAGLQTLYEACVRLGRDRTSSFYFDGRPYPHGSNVRIYFWRGVAGIRPLGLRRGTGGWAAWMAGRDSAADLREVLP